MLHRGLLPIIVYSNDDPGLTLTYFTARSNFWKKVDFSETIAACDLKVGGCRQLIEFMKEYLYSRSGSFLDLGQRSFTYEN